MTSSLSSPEASTSSSPSLWSADDVVRWFIMCGAGVALIVVSQYITAGKDNFGGQFGYLDLAVLGLIVAGVGHMLFLLRGRRDIGNRYQRLFGTSSSIALQEVLAIEDFKPRMTSAELVGGSTLHLFHRADCPMARGRGWKAMMKDDHLKVGREPCPICRP
jgi:hypothetical protein